jgi:SAM-dependent methyltransferase
MSDPVPFDPTVPNVARMYDYYLGGKDNFAADRAAAEQALTFAPELRVGAREVRKFLQRAVNFLTDAGVRQFLDIGCGLPTQGNVHEIAQKVIPDARVAYVDNDPVVISHGRALLDNSPHTAVIQADLRDPAAILAHPEVRATLDLTEPVGVLLIAVLHVIPEDEVASRVVTELRDALPSGSYVAICHAVSDLVPETTAKLASLYQDKMSSSAPRRTNLRSKAEVETYFDGLELVEPGVVYLPEWRPEPGDPGPGDTPVWSVAGVGRKP